MKVGLLGHGVVGSGVRKIIDDSNTKETKDLEVVKILVKDKSEVKESRMTLNPDDVLNDPEIEVVVECMGGIEPARSFALQAMQHGKHFVTSNKKMLAASFKDLYECASQNGVTLHYEASCGGGIPWMANLERTKRVDAITSFRGIFNGTTNYILSRMVNEGKDFDELLKEAQSLGYAEKDPTDDIDGFDVRYKVALSCLKAFDLIVEPSSISMYGIRHITKEDVEYCLKNGYVVKMIGKGVKHGGSVEASVMPMFVKNDDVFASIPLNFNAIESDSETLGKAVYIGQGAGSLPTAHAVVQDVIDILNEEKINSENMVDGNVDNNDTLGVYYIRTVNKDVFLDVVDKVGDNVIVTKHISLTQLNQLIEKANDETLFVAEVME